MAIARDNSIAVRTDGTTGNFIQAFTCSGANRALVVAAFTTNNTISATYGGVSMTKVQTTSNSNGWEIDLFLLINPASGSNSLVINYATGGTHSGFVASSYTGVKQTGQPDSSANIAQGTTSPYAMATTAVASGCWLVGCAESNTTGAIGAGSGSSLVGSLGNASNTDLGLLDSNGTVGTGSQSLNVTVSGVITNVIGELLSLAPAPSSANGNFLAFM